MGELSSFIEREFTRVSTLQNIENEKPASAITAISAIFEPNNSKNSNSSSYSDLKITLEALQAESDQRNIKEYKNGRTFRYCRCGSLAECAWPLEGRRELWRCFRCLEAVGEA